MTSNSPKSTSPTQRKQKGDKRAITTSEYPFGEHVVNVNMSSPIKSPRFEHERHDSGPTQGEIKLRQMLKDIGDPADDIKSENEDETENRCLHFIRHSRHVIGEFLEKPKFHYFIIVLIIFDILVLFIDMIFSQLTAACLGPEQLALYNTTVQPAKCLIAKTPAAMNGREVVFYFSLTLLCIFVIEILFSFYAFGWRRFTKLLYFLDAVMVISSFIMEVYFEYGSLGGDHKTMAAVFFLRLWMILRAFHAVAHSISLRNGLLIENIKEALEVVEEEKERAHKKLEKRDIIIDYLLSLLRENRIEVCEEKVEQFVNENVEKEQPKEFL